MITSHQDRAREYDRRLRRFCRMLGLDKDLAIEYVAEIVCRGPVLSLRYRDAVLQGFPGKSRNGQPLPLADALHGIPPELSPDSTSWVAFGPTGIKGRVASGIADQCSPSGLLVAHDIVRKDVKPSASQIGIYEILHGWGFRIPPYLRLCNGADGIVQHMSGARAEADRCGLRVSGVRYRVNSLLLEERLQAISGSTGAGLALTIPLRN